MKKRILCFLFIILLNIDLIAVDSSSLLFDSLNSSSIGRGNVNTAWINEFDFIGNPAVISYMRAISVSISYWKYILDMNFMSTSIIYNINEKYGTSGINISMFDSGEFTLFNETGISSEKISGKDMVLSFVYGINSLFLRNLSFGAGFKYINNSLYQVSGSSFGFDFGLLYGIRTLQLGEKGKDENLFVGISLLNIGPGIKYSQEETALPLNIKAGMVHNIYKNDTINIKYGADFSYKDNNTNILLGVEIGLFDLVVPRLGYTIGTELNSFTAGLGVVYHKREVKMDFSYALIPMSEFGLTHILSLGVVINKDAILK